MLAILLVKMMRVYHIFNSVQLRLGRNCSDLSLASYVLLILVPDILVNLIWIFTDQYEIKVEYRLQNGVIYIEKVCRSKYQIVWFGILTVYLLVLIFALAVIAVVTRKVRLQHFKDTKKVNILLFILCFGFIICLSYWLLLQSLKTKRYIATLPLHIGHSMLIILFQTFLFIPKVFPPIWRYIKQKFIRDQQQETTVIVSDCGGDLKAPYVTNLAHWCLYTQWHHHVPRLLNYLLMCVTSNRNSLGISNRKQQW